MQPIFITGIGTGVGKTVAAAIVVQALQADYWKPVQAGFSDGTDSEWIKKVISNPVSKIHPEKYKLQIPASPHIAAREEGVRIDLDEIVQALNRIQESGHEERGESRENPISNVQYPGSDLGMERNDFLIIEGAGGLLVPLNDQEFMIDLVKKLQAKVIIVSRNYLGSINHSLLSSTLCKQHELEVVGWIFNDQYLSYEEEIVRWSGFPKIASLPFAENPGREFVHKQAEAMRHVLLKML